MEPEKDHQIKVPEEEELKTVTEESATYVEEPAGGAIFSEAMEAEKERKTELSEEDDLKTITEGSATYVQGLTERDPEDVQAGSKSKGKGKGKAPKRSSSTDERYLEQRSLPPKPDALNEDPLDHAKLFKTTMIEYLKMTKDDKSVDYSKIMNDSYSWEQVMRVVERAENEYMKKGKGIFRGSSIRGLGRIVGKHTESVHPYLRLIPNGYYESTIAGGLKIIFEASDGISHIYTTLTSTQGAMRLSDAREEMLKTLLKIPDFILQAEDVIEIFPGDPALYQKVGNLYVAALQAIEIVIKWFGQNPFVKQGKALVQGPRYNKKFDVMKSNLDEKLAALDRRVTVLRDGTIVVTKKTVENTKKTVENIEKVVIGVDTTGRTVEKRSAIMLEHLERLQEDAQRLGETTEVAETQRYAQMSTLAQGFDVFGQQQDAMQSKIDDMKGTQYCTHDKVHEVSIKMDDLQLKQHSTHEQVEKLNDVEELKSRMKHLMDLAVDTAKWAEKDGRAIRRLERKVKVMQEDQNGLNHADLLEIMDVSDLVITNDSRAVHKACQTINPEDMHIPEGILAGPKFTHWVANEMSGSLFLEGGQALAIRGRYAALSLMSCLVVECVKVKEAAMTMQHFCKLHNSSKDSLQGPQGMVRSLISQVLYFLGPKTQLGLTPSRKFREKLESHNLRALCECFAQIVRKADADTVLFCVIDGINEFEKHATAEDCRFVINELQDMVQEFEHGPIFKLFITSPVRSKFVGNMFNPQSRLLLSGDGSLGRDDPTEREMAHGIRRRRAPETAVFKSLRSTLQAKMQESSDGSSDSDSSSASDTVTTSYTRVRSERLEINRGTWSSSRATYEREQ